MHSRSPLGAFLAFGLAGLMGGPGPFLDAPRRETPRRMPRYRRAQQPSVLAATAARRKAHKRRRNKLARLSRRANRGG